MANKFLGEAGLDVLTSQIKTRTYVGQMLDEVLAAFEYIIQNGQNDYTSSLESMKNYYILTNFTGTRFAQECELGDISSAGIQTTYDKMREILNNVESDAPDMATLEDIIRSSAFFESSMFGPASSSSETVGIEEITAQEVTDKFNS